MNPSKKASAALDAAIAIVEAACQTSVETIDELGVMPPQERYNVDVNKSLQLFILSQVAERQLDKMDPTEAAASACTFVMAILDCVGITPADLATMPRKRSTP